MWGFRSVNKTLLNLETSLQPLKEGCFFLVQLWEYLSARHGKPERAFSLCSAERNRLVSLVQTLLHVHQHRTLVCTDHQLSGAPEWPGVTKILFPVHPRAFQTACLGAPYVTLPYWCHIYLPRRRDVWEPCQAYASTCTQAMLANLVPVQLMNLSCRPRLLCKVDITTKSSRVSYSSIIANVNICSYLWTVFRSPVIVFLLSMDAAILYSVLVFK